MKIEYENPHIKMQIITKIANAGLFLRTNHELLVLKKMQKYSEINILDNEYLRFEMTWKRCSVPEICEREEETPKNVSVICKKIEELAASSTLTKYELQRNSGMVWLSSTESNKDGDESPRELWIFGLGPFPSAQ